MTEFVDVVIVGAGISGISAAWHLQDRCPTKSYADPGTPRQTSAAPGTCSSTRASARTPTCSPSGFRFKPWTSDKAIADGPSIMAYLKETAAENGIDKHIRYGHKVVAADWSDADNRWTVTVERDGEQSEITCVVPVRLQRLLQLRRGLLAGVPGRRGLRGHHRAPAALAGGPRLRRARRSS